MRPASTFFIIQLLNSRAGGAGKIRTGGDLLRKALPGREPMAKEC